MRVVDDVPRSLQLCHARMDRICYRTYCCNYARTTPTDESIAVPGIYVPTVPTAVPTKTMESVNSGESWSIYVKSLHACWPYLP